MADYLSSGIDVSEFNGQVDFAALKGKIGFAIIRCGYGSNYENQDDSEYETNVRKCEAAGIPYGVYLYSYARNPEMARSEGEHALRLLKGKRPLYGVWYDVEDSTLPSGETLITNCETFCSMIEEAGFYCGIYSSLDWMETRLNSPRLARFDRWVAYWGADLERSPAYGIWQYTNNGIINGKRFDLDRAYRDYPRLIEEMEGTDMTREEVAALARKEAQTVYDKNEERYATIDSVPGWAREAVQQVYDRLGLTGTGTTADGKTRIDASHTYVRAVYVIAQLLNELDELEKREPEGE